MEFQATYRERKRVAVLCPAEERRTKQSFRDECDINLLMKRYASTGVLPPGVGVGSYGDFSGPQDLLEAQEVIRRAEAQFRALPAEVRARFRNDPERLLAFVQDERNQAEAKRLGLLEEELPPKFSVEELKDIADRAAAAAVAAAKGEAPPAPPPKGDASK